MSVQLQKLNNLTLVSWGQKFISIEPSLVYSRRHDWLRHKSAHNCCSLCTTISLEAQIAASEICYPSGATLEEEDPERENSIPFGWNPIWTVGPSTHCEGYPQMRPWPQTNGTARETPTSPEGERKSIKNAPPAKPLPTVGTSPDSWVVRTSVAGHDR